MDAIKLLKQDHRTVEALFKKFEGLGDRAEKQKQLLVERMIKELSIHAAIEEMLLYPSAREKAEEVDGIDDEVLEALEEHHVVKWVLLELSKLTPDAERFDAKVKVLMDLVRHHVGEEENDLFPDLEKAVDHDTLELLGQALEEAKKLAPTHPHPRAPDEPPGIFVAEAFAKVVDAGRDLVAGRLQHRREASARAARLKKAELKAELKKARK